MANLKINGNEIEFTPGMTVLQVCEKAGIEIPKFCYHEKLAIAGNCRMCLVEIKGGPPKPVASCAMPAAENMQIFTSSPMVKKAREGVMEFLLANHPLDCPICDQGGECDLQDQAMFYGKTEGKFDENKRSVKNKNMGPLIKTSMNRCIHCTRCVRFITDIAGVSELGIVGRGENAEITTYIEKSLTSELSGNIIDLCPVGALTSKPYAFKARSWELDHTNSIDVMDAVGSHIRIDSKEGEVMRILPRENEHINDEWLSNKARFSYDGLLLQRLDQPMIRKNGKLEIVDWNEAIEFVCEKIKTIDSSKLGAIAGDLTDVETMFLVKKLFNQLGSKNIDCRQRGENFDANNRASYIFNSTIDGINKADFCLLIGTNPKIEAPIINARIRKAYLDNNLVVARIGGTTNLTYPVQNLGNDIRILADIASQKADICKLLEHKKQPMIIIGADMFKRNDIEYIMHYVYEIAKKYQIITHNAVNINILHKHASMVGGLDIGFVPQGNGKTVSDMLSGDMGLIWLLGADEIDHSKLKVNNNFVIYQGHHGANGAEIADVILPGAAYTEKNSTYVNTEGRVQRTTQAVFSPGNARSDWQIISVIANNIFDDFGFKNLQDVRAGMAHASEIFAEYNLGVCEKSKWQENNNVSAKLNHSDQPVVIDEFNYYMTNIISRNSITMANCVKEI